MAEVTREDREAAVEALGLPCDANGDSLQRDGAHWVATGEHLYQEWTYGKDVEAVAEAIATVRANDKARGDSLADELSSAKFLLSAATKEMVAQKARADAAIAEAEARGRAAERADAATFARNCGKEVRRIGGLLAKHWRTPSACEALDEFAKSIERGEHAGAAGKAGG